MRRLIAFLSILTLLLISYLPALTHQYVYHDATVFFYRPSHMLYNHQFHGMNFFDGRLLGAYVLTFWGWLIDSVSDLKFVRFFNILIISICAYILHYQLKRHVARATAFGITIAMFTLPPFQTICSMSSMSALPASLLLATVAAAIIDSAPAQNRLLLRLFHVRTLLSSLTLLCAFMTYQATGTFFWVFAASVYIFSSSEDPSKKHKLIHYYTVGFISLFLYYGYLKILKTFITFPVNNLYDPYMMEMNYLSKLLWFIKEPLANALNLYWLDHRLMVIAASSLFCLSFFVIPIFQSKNMAAVLKPLSEKALVVSSLLILGFLPNLVSVTRAPYYRCSAGLFAIILLLIVRGFYQALLFFPKNLREKIFLSGLTLLCLTGIFTAHDNILKYRIIRSEKELALMINSMQKAVDQNIAEIYIQRPSFTSIWQKYDEFGAITSMFDGDIYPYIICALREVEAKRDKNNIYWGYKIDEPHGKLKAGFVNLEKATFKEYEFTVSANRDNQKAPFELPNTVMIDTMPMVASF